MPEAAMDSLLRGERLFQVQRSAPVYDVVVIGSGAGGGTAVQVLTKLGIKVALIEAGPLLNPAKDYKEHMWPYQVPHRGAGDHAEAYFGRSGFGFFSAPNGYWDIEGEPYTVAPGSEFRWFRSRILGGRTNHYGRISLRFADYDFQQYSTDGLGHDWPITYNDVAPYYDKAEAFIGICGSKEGIRTAPDGIFQPAPALRAHEYLIQRASLKLGIPCIPARMAILTKPLNGRPACHYCAQCGRGCVTASNYSSSQVQIIPAMKTGNLTVIPNAMARELITNDQMRVTAVSYVDKATREEKQVRCRAVIVAASACESARLLLNSKSPRHAGGLANSSGTVGRYLTDTVGYALTGYVPAFEGMPKHDDDGYAGGHVYMPWWGFDKKNKEFPRGYHVEVGGGFGMPGIGSFSGVAHGREGYGASLKQAIRDGYGCGVSFSGRGEMIPNEHSFCDIDPNVVDQWGIPVLRFHFAWSDYETKMVKHMHDTFSSLVETMGGRVLGRRNPEHEGAGISTPGTIIHELGTVRMGKDPNASALNGYSQSHDVKNLFVADAAPFVTNPDKNPTLTICALSWRTSEYVAEELRKGNV
jgi:choline dehydrogenase-like flavoprotein